LRETSATGADERVHLGQQVHGLDRLLRGTSQKQPHGEHGRIVAVNLEDAILEALRPMGRRAVLRNFFSGGLTVLQVLERLPPDLRNALLAGDGLPQERRRGALDQVVRGLFVHIDAGRVQRRRTRLRTSMVDVYRLA